jgi:ubiquinone/menaquinone biosynthesis C-methylase UbiE
MIRNMTDSSFPETADIETSNDDYATRFAGPTGQWLLDVQETITRELIGIDPGSRILDVGGGHGQLAMPLCDAGYALTVLGSAASCRQRIQGIVDSGACTFDVGNVIELPYPDNHFDEVICFRLLTHCERWPVLVNELCRVSRGAVIVDYPTSQSLNAIAPLLFGAKKRIEKNTRTWKLFKHREVREAFASAGYVQERRKAQFFLPMVLHRAIKSRKVSALLEAPFRALGFTHAWGSPVIIRMVPQP